MKLEARILSFEKSNDNFPIHFILLGSKSKQIIGHCLLKRTIENDKIILVESVIVDIEKRGLNYGQELMNMVEKWAKEKGIEWFYLSTNDKQNFYEKLGYSSKDCEVVNAVSSSISSEKLNKLKLCLGNTSDPNYTWLKKCIK
eukprot:TRINITY_DN5519_c0_g1_i1.p1 TRINITY_DN5519_c0_g1~~TRINITY_DN5519_c0_g1_i1.p1  ORF type:complete len:143 (+),score=24.96 TRINITY_DN5519_c0_g1_i1:196-624(+)